MPVLRPVEPKRINLPSNLEGSPHLEGDRSEIATKVAKSSPSPTAPHRPSESATPGKAARLKNLDALRGIAALAVMLYHFTCTLEPTWFTALFTRGWMGVEVFFVISGFILPSSMQARGDYSFPSQYPRYVWKRVLRLHPPYLASLGVILIQWHLATLVPGYSGDLPDFSMAELAAHPFLLNDILGLRWVVAVYWTLAIELQFCLFLGIVYPLLRHRSYWMAVVAGCIVAGMLPVSRIWLLPFLPVFGMGILAWKGLQDKESRAAVLSLGIGTVLAAVAAEYTALEPLGIRATLVGSAAAMGVAFWRKGIPGWLAGIGTISYSLYLLHAVLGNSIKTTVLSIPFLPAGGAGQAIACLVAAAGSLLLAWLFYRIVERPAVQWASRRAKREA